MTSKTIRAALIDMDGTIYDSMPRHADAWMQMCRENGLVASRDEFFLWEGRTGASTISLLMQRLYGRDATAEEVERLYHRKTELFSAMEPPIIMPGFETLVEWFTHHSIECTLVTGSGQSSLIKRLDRDFPGVFPPERRVTSRDVKHGKPSPEPYLMALEKAGVTASEALVLENAPLGVKSGVAAGIFTVGVVTGPIPRQEFVAAGADLVFDSMKECAEKLPQYLVNHGQ